MTFCVDGQRSASSTKYVNPWHDLEGGYGPLADNIVRITDRDRRKQNDGIPIYLDDQHTNGFVDRKDGKSPRSQMKAVQAALTKAGQAIGHDFKPATANSGLVNLMAALNALGKPDSPNKYDLEKLLAILRAKGITLAQLTTLGASGLTGDALIAKLAEMLGIPPESILSEAGKASEKAFAEAASKLGAATKAYADAVAAVPHDQAKIDSAWVALNQAFDAYDSAGAKSGHWNVNDNVGFQGEDLALRTRATDLLFPQAATTRPADNATAAVIKLKNKEVAPKEEPKAAARKTPEGKTSIVVGTNGNTITIEWRDSDTDGKIDKNEREGAVIVYKGKEYKLTPQLAELIDRRMNADSAISDQDIEKSELEGFLSAVGQYAGALGLTLDQALQAYSEADSFANVSIAALQESRTEFAGYLTGVDLNKGADVRAALEKQGVSPALIDSILAYINSKQKDGKTTLNASDIGAYANRCAMASMTGRYDLFEIAHAESVQKMARFAPKEVSKEKLVSWYSGSDVNGDDDAPGNEGVAKNDREEERKILNGDYNKKEYGGIAGQREKAVRHLQSLVENGNIEQAESFYERYVAKDAGVKTNERWIELMVNGYTKGKDPAKYGKALALIESLPDSNREVRNELLARLAQRYLTLSDPKLRAQASEIIGKIKGEPGETVKWGDKPYPISQLANHVEEQLLKHPEIMAIEEEYIKEEEDRAAEEGKKDVLVSGKKPETAIAKLGTIIADDTKKYSAYDKAYASYVQARLYKLQAERATGDAKKAIYLKAQQAMARADRLLYAIPAGERTEADSQLLERANKWMINLARTVYYSKLIGDDKEKSKKFGQELATYLRNDAAVSGELRGDPENQRASRAYATIGAYKKDVLKMGNKPKQTDPPDYKPDSTAVAANKPEEKPEDKKTAPPSADKPKGDQKPKKKTGDATADELAGTVATNK